MSAGRVLYLNFLQAESGSLGREALPRDYVLACRFLHCSIVDRSSTLDQGFAYTVLDPIPAAATDGATFADLCDGTGAALVAEALATDREIEILWSGGIDSTAALIAVMKAAETSGCGERVRVLLSLDSVHEYPRFFLREINGRYRCRSICHPIAEYLDPAVITVTGEHGDQLFGSHLLESYVRRGLGGVDYREILPLVLLERLRSIRAAARVGRYLAPVFAAAPVPIRSLFDALWWLNFCLKWQDVTLRMPVVRGQEARAIFAWLRHFYRGDRFQAWALANAGRCPPVWARYKDVAKRYILDYTGDDAYYRYKEKELSLRNLLTDPVSGTGYRVLMREDFRPVFSAVERGD
jgi:hypothetical protein